jgi:hypothetical protein
MKHPGGRPPTRGKKAKHKILLALTDDHIDTIDQVRGEETRQEGIRIILDEKRKAKK